MSRRILPLAALLVTGVTGCATVSDFFSDVFSSSGRGPGQVGTLVGQIERVYVDAEVAKETSVAAHDALQVIVAPQFKGDAVAAHTIFVEAIERSEAQAKKLRSSVSSMQRAAEPVFAQWVKDLEVYKSPELRERSRVRLDETRKNYDKMVATVEAARTEYEALNESLRDYALYLGNDFNSASVADIRSEVSDLTSQTRKLNGRLDECLVVTRSYIDNAALPGRPASDGDANRLQSAERVQPVSGTVK